MKIYGIIQMKKRKKRKERKRGKASRKRIENQTTQMSGEVIFSHHNEEKQQRL